MDGDTHSTVQTHVYLHEIEDRLKISHFSATEAQHNQFLIAPKAKITILQRLLSMTDGWSQVYLGGASSWW
jgi:hypothetical protein